MGYFSGVGLCLMVVNDNLFRSVSITEQGIFVFSSVVHNLVSLVHFFTNNYFYNSYKMLLIIKKVFIYH